MCDQALKIKDKDKKEDIHIKVNIERRKVRFIRAEIQNFLKP